jgi:hypothetical protein
MKMPDIRSFDDFEEYLKHFTSWGDDQYIYDFGGVCTLFLALLDNMQRNGVEAEIDEIGGRFTPDQREFLEVICRSVQNFREDQ